MSTLLPSFALLFVVFGVITAAPHLAPCTQLSCDIGQKANCYKDSNLNRTMNDANVSSNTMTHSECSQFCYSALNNIPNFYAGVEFGHQCFCGRSAPDATRQTDPTECNVPCDGNHSETCGAAGRLEVYQVTKCTENVLKYPFCNTSLSIADRVEDLIGRMTPAEKINCIDSKTCSLPRFGIGLSWHESLHGLRYPCARDVLGHDTVCATRCE